MVDKVDVAAAAAAEAAAAEFESVWDSWSVGRRLPIHEAVVVE